jgi:hypothetical protein
MTDPRDPFSEVVDERRRWTTDWYTWLTEIAAETKALISQNSAVVAGTTLATTATSGFMYVPRCAGPPTGVPVGHAGAVPLVYDSTNNRLYVFNGTWKSVLLA